MGNSKKYYPYGTSMEMTVWEYKGINKTSHGMESAYQNPRFFKNECLNFIKKLRKRVIDIATNDIVLKEILLKDLERIEADIKKIVKEDTEPHVIAQLFRLVAHLLGWAHYEGDFFRTPIYHQTEEQKKKSLEKIVDLEVPAEIIYHKRQLVLSLRKKGFNHQKIALILGLTDVVVKSLEETTRIDEWYQEELVRKKKK